MTNSLHTISYKRKITIHEVAKLIDASPYISVAYDETVLRATGYHINKKDHVAGFVHRTVDGASTFRLRHPCDVETV